MKKKVLVRGPLLSQSGYGNHARQVVKWLLQRDDVDVCTQVLHWGITPWHIDSSVEDGLIGEIMQRSITNMPTGIDITYQVQLPHEWDPSLGKINVGVTAAVETDVCTPEWITACNRMNAVVVPSKFTKNTLERSGRCTTPITVIPESYIPEITQDVDPLPVDFSTDFNFLLFGMLTGQNPRSDRKNLFYTIKWILEEFKDDPNVGIVLKTSSGRATKIDKKVTMKIVGQAVKEIRTGQFPKVHFMHGSMTNSEVAAIYRHPKIKALVALTRGEGYGLPILEAAASDLPVVATNWSGHLDFMNKGKFVAVDYKMQQIDQTRADDHIFLRHARWAEPSEKDAKKRLRKLYESYQTPKQWATSLGKTLREDLSHEKICVHWDNHLAELLE